VFIGSLAAEVADGDVTIAANPHLRLIFGYSPETAEENVVPFAAARFADAGARPAFLERLTADRAVTDYLLRLRRLDGSPVWVEVTARSEIEDGQVHIEALVRDVSERRKLEDQSRDLYQQLLQAEKMAALGQTISGVAHELNNPLGTILSWAERLSERPLDDKGRRGVQVILGEAERAARIVRNLLTFARKRQSTRTLVDINEIARDTLALRSYEQRMAIKVVTDLAGGLPQVFADGHQIQQVLLNLIINAEQAMMAANGRGVLSLNTSHDADADMVVLEVRDDGPGVAPDLRGKIFDPFFTTKDVGQGTGLGLSVAYAIVNEHGGRIRVDSPTGGGAAFVVELPAGGAGRAPKTPRAPLPSMEAVRGAQILLVEDELALASAVAEALTDAGLQVDHAIDGEEALARVRRSVYDAVVCDLKMPRVDGMMVYRAIAAATPSLARRVIFVTGAVAGTDAERFLDESGCRWLPKPFRLSDLLRAVRETLA
jgi:PAS domain S-box-containing protein